MNRFALLLITFLILVTGCGGPTTNIQPGTPPPTNPENSTEPTALTIPSIGVDVRDLDTFGLDNKGNYACPPDPKTVAWNRDGTAPGEPGLALIVASTQGPFQRLDQLKPGDPVYITRAGGNRLTFKTINTSPGASAAMLQLAECGERTGSPKYAVLTP